MKFSNGRRFVVQMLEMMQEDERLPKGFSDFVGRCMDDIYYNEDRKISDDTLNHFKKYYEHLFSNVGESEQ